MIFFSTEQTGQLNERTKRFEQNTGAEIVVTIREKSDHYPEIPWKAFAFGVGVGMMLIILNLVFSLMRWSQNWPLFDVAFILGLGIASAAITIFWSRYARLFLTRLRASGEVEQCAKDFFLDREIFKTEERAGILILLSLFERQVVILPDTGFGDRLDRKSLEEVVAEMAPALRKGDCVLAILQGLGALEAVLQEAGFKGRIGDVDQIQDEIVLVEGGDK